MATKDAKLIKRQFINKMVKKYAKLSKKQFVEKMAKKYAIGRLWQNMATKLNKIAT